MPEKHLYEYAVIRLVPRVEREEFINVGIILFCKRARFIQVRCHLDEEKLRILAPGAEADGFYTHLRVFDLICSGAPEGGPIARLDIAERFRWLTAVRSASVQTSRPHPGLTDNLEETCERLFRELVL